MIGYPSFHSSIQAYGYCIRWLLFALKSIQFCLKFKVELKPKGERLELVLSGIHALAILRGFRVHQSISLFP